MKQIILFCFVLFFAALSLQAQGCEERYKECNKEVIKLKLDKEKLEKKNEQQVTSINRLSKMLEECQRKGGSGGSATDCGIYISQLSICQSNLYEAQQALAKFTNGNFQETNTLMDSIAILYEKLYKDSLQNKNTVARLKQDIKYKDSLLSKNMNESNVRIQDLNRQYEQLSDEFAKVQSKLEQELKTTKATLVNTQQKLQETEDAKTRKIAEVETYKDLTKGLQEQVDQKNKYIDTLSLKNQQLDFLKKRHQHTIYLGVHYSLLREKNQTDYNFEGSGGFFRKMGFSVYLPYFIGGVFLSNAFSISDDAPQNFYSFNQALNAQNVLIANGATFNPLQYKGTAEKTTRLNTGIYLNPYFLNIPIRFMMGIAIEQGQRWKVYNGNLKPVLWPNAPLSTYAVDKEELNNIDSFNKIDWIYGLAYVDRFFQVEVGFNKLYEAPFANIGMNVPINIKKTPK